MMSVWFCVCVFVVSVEPVHSEYGEDIKIDR